MGFLEGIALVSQLSGLHVIMLIAFAAHLLRIPQCKEECAKLEDCAQELRALLQCQAPILDAATQLLAMAAETLVEAVGGDMATQLLALASETLVEADCLDGAATQLLATAAKTLVEADGLVGSYRESTFWCRVQTSRSMEARLRGMQDHVSRLCVLVPATILLTLTDHPASDTTSNAIYAETSISQRNNIGTSQGGADHQLDNTEPGGYESAV